MSYLLVAVIIFFGIFTQSAAGFGMALVSMPLLSTFAEIKFISPLIALVGILAKLLLLVNYRREIEFKAVYKLVLSSLLFVPVGTYALNYLDENTSIFVLGVVVLGYAVYSLINMVPPRLSHSGWVYFFGAIAGFLGGAYNASGPPVVIYANSRRWGPKKFKANLQAYALINGIGVSISHFFAGNITPQVWRGFAYSIPAVVLGVWLGVSLDKYLDEALFQKLVLWLLIILGIRMII